MKKKWFNIVLAILAANLVFTPLKAEQGLPWSVDCDTTMKILKLAPYFCQCKENSYTFSFPLEMEINDTTWFEATINDMRQGISAYWFANCTVTLDVYAFCSSEKPTFSMVVGQNQMCDMDVSEINQKLAELDEQAQFLVEAVKPHIRVYPNKEGGAGHVYCYPYDEGPLSTCENTLPLRPGMTYVCDKPENVYSMNWNLIDAQGRAFIHWKQKKNLPCEVWLTLDSCTGQEIGRALLSDSLHVYQPNPDTLLKARSEHHSLWMHVKHAEQDEKGNKITGRIRWCNNPKYFEEELPETAKTDCAGQPIEVNLRSFTADTAFTDTLWITKDSLQAMPVSVTFTQPVLEYDTVHVTASQLARGYRYPLTGTIIREYKDTLLEVYSEQACMRLILLTVAEPAQGAEIVDAEGTKAYKQMINGQLFIIVDERKYNVLGQQTK